MDNRTFEYCSQQIGFTGFALISPHWASKLRPDIFSNAQMAVSLHGNTTDIEIQFECKSYMVTFQDGGTVKCISRSCDALIQRIQWLTGEDVAKVQHYITTPKQEVNRAELKYVADKANEIGALHKVFISRLA